MSRRRSSSAGESESGLAGIAWVSWQRGTEKVGSSLASLALLAVVGLTRVHPEINLGFQECGLRSPWQVKRAWQVGTWLSGEKMGGFRPLGNARSETPHAPARPRQMLHLVWYIHTVHTRIRRYLGTPWSGKAGNEHDQPCLSS